LTAQFHGGKIMKVLVPTAGVGPAKKNAEYILGIAKKLKAEVMVIHINDPLEDDIDEHAMGEFVGWGKKKDVLVTTEIIEGNVVPTIVDYAIDNDANLIIMGASKGRIVAEWVVTQVMDKCSVPVVIIPYQY
jgi:nucleotide-binding universal stress UspA family protein